MLAAIYCRLSREDLLPAGQPDAPAESESIQNQKSLLIQFALAQGWEIFGIYCDDDYSGIDRERPAFNRMLKAAEQRRFDILLVKTQSRFTRDMELVERYIHGKFIEWGIRFVATVDHVDTDIKGNKKARQINGLINEWYLEDLSENIRAVFDSKRRAGQYIGGFPLYGYQKDPCNKNQLVIEPEAAAVVREIFRLYLSGKGTQRIAMLLNERGIPNPTKHKQERGCPYRNGAAVNDYGLWNRTTVSRILHDRMYTGDLVQGKTKKISYKSRKTVATPKSDWVIVPNAQEAVIDRETFAAVQQLLAGRTTSSGEGEIHPLAGKVFCMDCGSVMHKVSCNYQGVSRSYLRCKLYATHHALCTNHNIRLDLLESELLCRIQAAIARDFDAGQLGALLPAQEDAGLRRTRQRELTRLGQEAEQRGKAIRALYLDRANGILGEAQFVELNESYWNEKCQLEQRIAALSEELARAGDEESRQAQLLQEAAQLAHPQALTRELVAQFVESIEVGARDPETKTQQIQINWLI